MDRLVDNPSAASEPVELERPGDYRPPPRDRRACFDAAVYDRLRVLTTELRRVQDEGGETALRVGAHTFGPDRLARLMLMI